MTKKAMDQLTNYLMYILHNGTASEKQSVSFVLGRIYDKVLSRRPETKSSRKRRG